MMGNFNKVDFSTKAVAISIALFLVMFVWARPLMLPDEGRYVGVAWEMIRSNDWLTPTLNGMPYFHKPPLFYWITAASISLFGFSELAARAAPLLGAWLGIFSMFLFLRRWSNRDVCLATTVVLAVQPLQYLGGQFANLDMLVAGLISATILISANAVLLFEKQFTYKHSVYFAYFFAALSVLAKGLIGVALPGMVIFFWLVLTDRYRAMTRLISAPGVIIFLLICSPWFLAMQQKFPEFLHYFFVVQHFTRFTTSGFNNSQPFWFYGALLVVAFIPWLKWIYQALVFRNAQISEAADIRALMFTWAAVVIIFFSIPNSKLIGYIFPALPPLCYFVAAAYIGTRRARSNNRFFWKCSAAIAFFVSLTAIGYLAISEKTSTKSLALALKAQHRSNEPVFMLRTYRFDLPIYAGLVGPMTVVYDWSTSDVSKKDDWRKELADAKVFAAKTIDGVTLLDTKNFIFAVCKSPVNWVIGSTNAPFLNHWPKTAVLVKEVNNFALWRVQIDEAAKANVCAKMPNVDLEKK
jgi:4-amino-4-deoxy-L-arabinose transferase-like glycosyltransferase